MQFAKRLQVSVLSEKGQKKVALADLKKKIKIK
jgi:hypothetical protein